MKFLCVFVSVLVSCAAAMAEPSTEWQTRNALAQQMNIGESAPDWLMDSESYVIGYNAGDWDALAESKVAFITHCPVNREFFARCHALGIRCFPYVTFYQGFANMTYEGVNLKDHPEFIEVNGDGNLVRTGFWESEDAKNMYTTCPNVQAYHDAMVAWVGKIMALGADGVFVDNLSSRGPCAGPKFGKHQHICEDQNKAFAMLLKRVRETVKQAKPDGAVLGNSASPATLPKEFWPYLDAEMLESYICTWVSTERWMDWKSHWNKQGRDLQPFVKAGKQIQALSYLGHTPYGLREDGFFCYASARLAGFVWSGGGSISDPGVADLYRLRLGKALTDEKEENGVHFRIFERGMVAVNPERDKAASITVAAPAPAKRLFDVFGDGIAHWDRYPVDGYRGDPSEKHGGKRSVMCTAVNATEAGGASQVITLNQTTAKAITVSGWSKAAAVTGAADANYALYIDAVYNDGEKLFGQSVPFTVGAHDWELKTLTIHPAKPIKSLTLNALFRNKTGKVWFDDISLREEGGTELVKNGGFEEDSQRGHVIDVAASGTIEIPAYSGRVFLFASDSNDDLAVKGPKLSVVTAPALGEVHFRVDGFDYWTHSGHWGTEYILGPSFGKFDILFEKAGKHTIEIVDVTPAEMKTPKGYGAGERLGQFMDPSNPTKPSDGKTFRFREWDGHGTAPSVEVDVTTDTTLTAKFDVK